MPVAIDANLLPAPVVGGIRNWAGPSCTANPFSCFVNPLIIQNNVYSSIGSALYQGGILEVKERFNPHISLIANYTYSKASDNVTDFNSDYAPFDQINLNGDRGLSEFDQRHKVVIASVLNSPWKPSNFLPSSDTTVDILSIFSPVPTSMAIIIPPTTGPSASAVTLVSARITSPSICGLAEAFVSAIITAFNSWPKRLT
jgi:hypothetical protein